MSLRQLARRTVCHHGCRRRAAVRQPELPGPNQYLSPAEDPTVVHGRSPQRALPLPEVGVRSMVWVQGACKETGAQAEGRDAGYPSRQAAGH